MLLLAVVLVHLLGFFRFGLIDQIDNWLYDVRLRSGPAKGQDSRIVIVDVDERSLAELGRWPWSRDKLAQLNNELFDRQGVAVVGYDMVFGESSDRHATAALTQLAASLPATAAQTAATILALAGTLDQDRQFADSLRGRPVVLGHYFTSDREGRQMGQLPASVMRIETDAHQHVSFFTWNGYGANLPEVMEAAAAGGYFNMVTDPDGVVRSVPLLTVHEGGVYQAFALAVYRTWARNTALGVKADEDHSRTHVGITLTSANRTLEVPTDASLAMLVPYRGPGGPHGGTFTYLSAADLVLGRLPVGTLRDKLVLVGTTAPGLFDLRATPVGPAYPGVEAHANLLAALMDGRFLTKPDYDAGLELFLALLLGIAMIWLLPRLTAWQALTVTGGLLGTLTVLNGWLYASQGVVLPQASLWLLLVALFVLQMVRGYLRESRAKRDLADRFGTYVPPEIVQEMLRQPEDYSMRAESREMTVLFCDIRGFTTFAEQMAPRELQTLLNEVFSLLTHVIQRHQGTVDKYMGDCVMAFWGAPLHDPHHARKAVEAAEDMLAALAAFNLRRNKSGLPTIEVGIGLNSGQMLVGDMGSDIRRSYTVLGDAVNVAARIQSLCRDYGVSLIAGETTALTVADLRWTKLVRLAVRGRQEEISIYTLTGLNWPST